MNNLPYKLRKIYTFTQKILQVNDIANNSINANKLLTEIVNSNMIIQY